MNATVPALVKTRKLLNVKALPVACNTPPAAPNVIAPLPSELLYSGLLLPNPEVLLVVLPALTFTVPKEAPAVMLIVVPPA